MPNSLPDPQDLLRLYRRGLRPTPRTAIQTLRTSARATGGPRGLRCLVLGRSLIRLGSGARIVVSPGGRLLFGRGGTKDVFDGDRRRAALVLGAGAELHIDGRVRIGYGAAIKVGDGATLHIGDDTSINAFCRILANRDIRIGSGCAFGTGATVIDSSDHPTSHDGGETWHEFERPVQIGDRCWLGAESLVLPGVSVGSGSVVAARAVVTRDLPPSSLAGGAPARVLRDGITWKP